MHRIRKHLAGLVSMGVVLAGGAAAADELAIGAQAPEFSLLGTDGKQHTLASVAAAKEGGTAARAEVVVFTCNHCPFAKAYEPILIDLQKRYADKGVAFVLISANDPEVVPEDAYDKMQLRAKEKGYPFPYLFDATQQTAKAYGATRTPQVFMLDAKQVVRYTGRINDNQDPAQVKSNDLTNALDALLAGKEIETASTKAFGCTIKWKKQS